MARPMLCDTAAYADMAADLADPDASPVFEYNPHNVCNAQHLGCTLHILHTSIMAGAEDRWFMGLWSRGSWHEWDPLLAALLGSAWYNTSVWYNTSRSASFPNCKGSSAPQDLGVAFTLSSATFAFSAASCSCVLATLFFALATFTSALRVSCLLTFRFSWPPADSRP